jgi:hypothetical protein
MLTTETATESCWETTPDMVVEQLLVSVMLTVYGPAKTDAEGVVVELLHAY